MTNTRLTLTLAGLIAVGFAVVIVLRLSAVPPELQIPDSMAAKNVAQTETDAQRDDAAPAAQAIVRTAGQSGSQRVDEGVGQNVVEDVGHASGNIRFEWSGTAPDARLVRIDLNVRSAVGVWLPDQKIMRVLLLESQPGSTQVTQLLNALPSLGAAESIQHRAAILELRFVANAQAFDRNEVDSARLMVSDGTVSSSADALSGLEWAGSLPSPQLALPPGSEQPTFLLTSSGDTATVGPNVGAASWKQAWRFMLSVPVVMHR